MWTLLQLSVESGPRNQLLSNQLFRYLYWDYLNTIISAFYASKFLVKSWKRICRKLFKNSFRIEIEFFRKINSKKSQNFAKFWQKMNPEFQKFFPILK